MSFQTNMTVFLFDHQRTLKGTGVWQKQTMHHKSVHGTHMRYSKPSEVVQWLSVRKWANIFFFLLKLSNITLSHKKTCWVWHWRDAPYLNRIWSRLRSESHGAGDAQQINLFFPVWLQKTCNILHTVVWRAF